MDHTCGEKKKKLFLSPSLAVLFKQCFQRCGRNAVHLDAAARLKKDQTESTVGTEKEKGEKNEKGGRAVPLA